MSREVMQGLIPGDMIAPWLSAEAARSLAIHGHLPHGGNKGDAMLLTVVGLPDASGDLGVGDVSVATIDPVHSTVRVVYSIGRYYGMFSHIVVWSPENVTGVADRHLP